MGGLGADKGDVGADKGDGDRFLNKAEEVTDFLADPMLPCRVHKSGDAGVRGVESVKDLVVLDLLFPHKHLLGVLAGDGSAAMAVDAAGHVPGFSGYSDQVFSQCIRGHRRDLRTLMSQAKSSSLGKSSWIRASLLCSSLTKPRRSQLPATRSRRFR